MKVTIIFQVNRPFFFRSLRAVRTVQYLRRTTSNPTATASWSSIGGIRIAVEINTWIYIYLPKYRQGEIRKIGRDVRI